MSSVIKVDNVVDAGELFDKLRDLKIPVYSMCGCTFFGGEEKCKYSPRPCKEGYVIIVPKPLRNKAIRLLHNK